MELIKDWVDQIASKNFSGYEVADKIISTGGNLEEDSCMDSMAQAMSELLMINPNIDLLNIDNDSIWTLIELFMANEVFNRLNLDTFQLFEGNRHSLREVVLRMNDMRDYLKLEISAQIQELRITKNQSSGTLKQRNNETLMDHGVAQDFEKSINWLVKATEEKWN